MKDERAGLKNKKRIVIKVGSSTITHKGTETLDYAKLEKLVRIITDQHNMGKDVVLVSSGAIAVGRHAIGLKERPKTLALKQACAAIGQASLMTVYQKLFSEYDQPCAQVLLTKFMLRDESYKNACNTFAELFKLGAVPIVNENDTVSTAEIKIGDNDSLSAYVTAMVGADLLILMSDIDGLYTADPNKDKKAKFISVVDDVEKVRGMAGDTASSVGTGGMVTKLHAATIATKTGADMVITNGDDVENIRRILNGEKTGTLFKAAPDKKFDFRNE